MLLLLKKMMTNSCLLMCSVTSQMAETETAQRTDTQKKNK
jgi:hypothetical protein